MKKVAYNPFIHRLFSRTLVEMPHVKFIHYEVRICNNKNVSIKITLGKGY